MKFNKKIVDLLDELEELKKKVWHVHRDFSEDIKRHSDQFYCYQLMMKALEYQMLANELKIELLKMK